MTTSTTNPVPAAAPAQGGKSVVMMYTIPAGTDPAHCGEGMAAAAAALAKAAPALQPGASATSTQGVTIEVVSVGASPWKV